MRTLGATLGGVHDRLKQRSENRRRNCGPVKPAGVEQCLPHGGVKVGDTQRAVEEITVDIRKTGQVLVECGLTCVYWRVKHLEEPREPQAQVRAILMGPLLKQLEEAVARLKDASIVGKQAEHGPHQKQIQVMAGPLTKLRTGIARLFERVVQATHEFGRLDVDRVLILEGALLYAQDEAELFNVVGQVGQGERPSFPVRPDRATRRSESR